MADRKPYYNDWYKQNKEKKQAQTNARKEERRKQLFDYKSKLSCCKCGFSHPAAIDFHHRNPKDKSRSISNLACSGIKWEVVLIEIKKCDVLCSNCHRILHHENRNVGLVS